MEPGKITTDAPEFKEAEARVNARINKLIGINGKRSVDDFHRELGLLMWDKCGMARNADGLKEAIEKIPSIREEFWQNLRVPGEGGRLNAELEKAGRVADFMEFAELMCIDALDRQESCGGHFREEYQFTKDDPEVSTGFTNEGEAKRRDDEFSYVAAWEHNADDNSKPKLHKEWLEFENVKLATRSYK